MVVAVFVKTAFILFVVIGVLAPIITWVERKQSALMQNRIGANRASVAGMTFIGLLHPAADVIKLLVKEDVVPAGANRVLHLLAPVMAAVPAIIAFAVIPFGGSYHFGETTIELVVANLDWGLLYIFAIGSLAAYGPILAGWASNSGWSFLGSLRASAQMLSYEVTLGFSVVGVFMVFQTLRLTDMAIAQDTTFRAFAFVEGLFGLTLPASLGWISALRLPNWGIFLQPLAFVLFLTAIMAENKRPPFDTPEGESEIVAGYHTEYSGMRFGLFYMSEFIGVVVIAGLITTIFFGGWSVPYLSQEMIIAGVGRFFGVGFATGFCMLVHFVSFMLKLAAMIWLQMALRWTLPRFRYDQVMNLCWKILLPLSLANIRVTGAVILALEGAA
ncbi:MAG: NADH-quinone oxidoreductase subunit H [Deltaproteobacteria bacterium]|nr:NADH-quinone oxidoreductase subunit H [Deltaproteobacteria bacterium]